MQLLKRLLCGKGGSIHREYIASASRIELHTLRGSEKNLLDNMTEKNRVSSLSDLSFRGLFSSVIRLFGSFSWILIPGWSAQRLRASSLRLSRYPE